MQPVFESTETFSQAEFAEWVAMQDSKGDHRYELLNGRILMTPPAGHPHGSIEAILSRALGNHVAERQLGHVFGSSQGFAFPSGDTLAPDVSYVSVERWRRAPAPELGKFLRVVPDLVIEILSERTRTRDRGEKKAVYEHLGVREYWLVDARGRSVTVFVMQAERFDGGNIYAEGEQVQSAALSGFTVDVTSLFAL